MTTATTARFVIKVTNNNDDGAGSLREAIRQGNQAVQEGKAVEIAFTSSFHIEAKTSYNLTQGDWTINSTQTRNITIDGKSCNGPVFVIGDVKNIKDSSGTDTPDLKVDVTRMNITNSHVKGGDGKNGGGGGLGAGSAILHFNGNVTWRDSTFQGNTVEGGKGAWAAKGDGQGRLVYGTQSSGPDGIRVSKSDWQKDGRDGGPGGNFNNKDQSRSLTGNNSGRTSRGGKAPKMYGDYPGNSRLNGKNGADGAHGEFGMAGAGGGNGSGGTTKSLYQGYQASIPRAKSYGKGGDGGDGGDAGFGAGAGTGGLPGGNAGNVKWGGWNASYHHKSWDKATRGNAGRSGEWASAATSGSKHPSWKNSSTWIPATRGRGGDGAALGVVTSFARRNNKNSFKSENNDFRDNKAQGGNNTGRFKNIFSRYIVVDHHNTTASTQEEHGQAIRGGRMISKNGSNVNSDHNTNSEHTDKTKTHSISGSFRENSATKAEKIIFSTSYKVDPEKVTIHGKNHFLDSNKEHIIVLTAEQDNQVVEESSVAGARQLINGLHSLIDSTHQTASSTANSSSNSLTAGRVANYASTKLKAKLTGHATTIMSNLASSSFKEAALQTVGSIAGFAGGVAGGFMTNLLFDLFDSGNSKAQELEAKKAIEKRRGVLKSLMPKPEEFRVTTALKGRTNDGFQDYKFGKDQAIFDKGILPAVRYSHIDGQGGILEISNSKNDQRLEFSQADKIAQLRLTETQANLAENYGNGAGYFEKLFHAITTSDGSVRYVLAKDTTWQYYTSKSDRAEIGGIANDRIIIKRDQYTKSDVNLTVNGRIGDDTLLGDHGKNTLIGEDGNDFFDPGKGSDIVRGGNGTDTTSYTSLRNAVTIKAGEENNLEASDKTENEPAWSDKLDSIEMIRTWGTSNHDLSKAAPSTLQGNGYIVATGAGGTTTGSAKDDQLLISYSKNFNETPSIALNGNTTHVDGLKGSNTLYIDGLNELIIKGNQFKLETTNADKSQGKLFKLTNNKQKEILSFSNINKGVMFTDVKTDNNGLLISATNTAKGKVKELLEADLASTESFGDWGLPGDETDALTGSTSSDVTGTNSSSSIPQVASPRAAALDTLLATPSVIADLPEETVQSTLASTVSMEHTAWEPGQERQQQPVWAQREFFIDPLA